MYEIFEKLLKETGLTAYRVAKETGLSTATLTSWKQGVYTPKIEKLQKIADFFDVDLEYLQGFSNVRKLSKTTVQNVIRKKGIKIPVLGSVPAGIPIEAIEDVLDYEEIDEDIAKNGEYFGLKIKGNSMYPLIVEDDIVIVKKQSIVESGQVAIVMVNGDEATCKKVIIEETGIMLVGYNPEFTPIYYSADDVAEKPVRIIGRVIEARRSF